MEKNFVAHLEKKYPRKPYNNYPVFDRKKPENSLLGFVWREQIELNRAVDLLEKHIKNNERTGIVTITDIRDQIVESMNEIADVSNTLDYLFEGLFQAYLELEGEKECR